MTATAKGRATSTRLGQLRLSSTPWISLSASITVVTAHVKRAQKRQAEEREWDQRDEGAEGDGRRIGPQMVLRRVGGEPPDDVVDPASPSAHGTRARPARELAALVMGGTHP
jgi:hypothetical protein